MITYKRAHGVADKVITYILVAFAVSAMIFSLIFNTETTNVVKDSIKSTVNCVIPALFPFMIFSKFVVLLTENLKVSSKRLDDRIRIWGIESCTVSTALIGFVSGFPLGGYAVCDLYSSGCLSKESAERAIAVSHNTGPAFCINVIGGVLWGNMIFGVSVYLAQIFSWIILVALLSITNRKASGRASQLVYSTSNTFGVALKLSNSITSAALSSINIGAFIAFWKIIMVLQMSIFPKMPQTYWAVVAAICEFSEGAGSAADLGGVIGAALTGFSVGFGGISALMQVYIRSSKDKLSVKKLFVFKLAHGLLCSIFSIAAYMIILPEGGHIVAVSVISISKNSMSVFSMIALGIIVALAFAEIFRKLCNHKKIS